MIDPKGDWTTNLIHSRKEDGLRRITLTGWELGECAAQWGDVLTQPLQLFLDPRLLQQVTAHRSHG